MSEDRRVIFSDNGTLVDITKKVSGAFAESVVVDYTAGQDYIYVGQVLPFNHLYFNFSALNTITSTMNVEFWDGQTWSQMVDIRDQTEGFKKAEHSFWSVPRDESWVKELDSFDVTGLETTEIYNMYWSRISFSVTLDVTTAISYIGQLYSTDQDLYGYYPDLQQSTLKDQYQTGKTDWREQGVLAAENIISYLRAKNIIKADASIMRPDLLETASIHKTAEIIFGAFGEAYRDDRNTAKKAFEDSINMKFFQTDVDKNGRLNEFDRVISTGSLSR